MQLSPVHTSWQSSGFLTCLLIFPFLQSCQKHSWICPKSSLLAQTSSNCYSSLLSATRQASIGLRDVHPDEVKTCPAIKAHQQIPVTEAPSFGSNACSSHKSAILMLHSFLIEKSVTSPPEGTKTSLTSLEAAGEEWKHPPAQLHYLLILAFDSTTDPNFCCSYFCSEEVQCHSG